MEYMLVYLLAGVSFFFIGKYFLLRYEVRRLDQQVDSICKNAAYGQRLYLEEKDTVMADAIDAINRMVDHYEHTLCRVNEMERNIRYSISSISHDLRTPLTALTGYLQLCAKEPLSDKQKEYLQAIFDATGMLRDLTDNFYELSCLDLGEHTFAIQNVNLAHMFGECFLSFYENFNQQNITLTIKEPEAPPVVLADKTALKRVLYNLIQNLLRYAHGEVTVSFSEEREYFSATIGNNTAISLEVNRIFERFYTADASRNTPGRGLGLYISQQLIHKLNGTITAYQDNSVLYITIALPKGNG